MAVERQVRQECLFGCVICGMPIFDYDHIVNFSIVNEHEASNIALLCPNHHREKTAGRLSAATVKNARAKPFNAGKTNTSALQMSVGDTIDIFIGSNRFSYPSDQIDYDLVNLNGESFFTTHDEGNGRSYSLRLFDEFGNPLLLIDHGALRISTESWDYNFEGKELTIRSDTRKIEVLLELSETKVALKRGQIVDRHQTGIFVDTTGACFFTFGGMHVGSIERGDFGINAGGALAVVRGSCYDSDNLQRGFGLVRTWAPEYELAGERLRLDYLKGIPGPRPRGLRNFRAIL